MNRTGAKITLSPSAVVHLSGLLRNEWSRAILERVARDGGPPPPKDDDERGVADAFDRLDAETVDQAFAALAQESLDARSWWSRSPTRI